MSTVDRQRSSNAHKCTDRGGSGLPLRFRTGCELERLQRMPMWAAAAVRWEDFKPRPPAAVNRLSVPSQCKRKCTVQG